MSDVFQGIGERWDKAKTPYLCGMKTVRGFLKNRIEAVTLRIGTGFTGFFRIWHGCRDLLETGFREFA
jgi:hypothetical protein